MLVRESRVLVRKALFLTALFLLLVLMLPACVSVQKTGQQATAPPPVTTVQFRSTVNPAEVYIDGQFRGTTPVDLQLAAGSHTIEIKLAGYLAWSRELVVVAGDDTQVAATLQQE